MPYNIDRRLSSRGPTESRWDFSEEARNVEYRMLYLLEADKHARQLMDRLDTLDQELFRHVMTVNGNLDEVLECSFREAIPYFEKVENPTLLLMMLFHYEVYRKGSAMERWDGTISALRKIDPEIAGKAKRFAEEVMARGRRTEKGRAPNWPPASESIVE